MVMNLNVEKMRQFLNDFRDNDPDFMEKIKEAIRKSISDNSFGTLFWKFDDKFFQADVSSGVTLINTLCGGYGSTVSINLANHYCWFPMFISDICDGYGFIVPMNWANHCGWISFGEDEDGNETIMCPSQDPENPHVVYSFYELWDTVLDYYGLNINLEIERIIDYWEKWYINR